MCTEKIKKENEKRSEMCGLKYIPQYIEINFLKLSLSC